MESPQGSPAIRGLPESCILNFLHFRLEGSAAQQRGRPADFLWACPHSRRWVFYQPPSAWTGLLKSWPQEGTQGEVVLTHSCGSCVRSSILDAFLQGERKGLFRTDNWAVWLTPTPYPECKSGGFPRGLPGRTEMKICLGGAVEPSRDLVRCLQLLPKQSCCDGQFVSSQSDSTHCVPWTPNPQQVSGSGPRHCQPLSSHWP